MEYRSVHRTNENAAEDSAAMDVKKLINTNGREGEREREVLS